MGISRKIEDFKGRTKVITQHYLEWYDAPILFPLKTDRGQELCIVVDDTEPMEGKDYGQSIFASVLISEEDLKEVVEGRTDLRSAFEAVENPRVFIWQTDGSISFQDLDEPLPEKYLSEKGAYLIQQTSEEKVDL